LPSGDVTTVDSVVERVVAVAPGPAVALIAPTAAPTDVGAEAPIEPPSDVPPSATVSPWPSSFRSAAKAAARTATVTAIKMISLTRTSRVLSSTCLGSTGVHPVEGQQNASIQGWNKRGVDSCLDAFADAVEDG